LRRSSQGGRGDVGLDRDVVLAAGRRVTWPRRGDGRGERFDRTAEGVECSTLVTAMARHGLDVASNAPLPGARALDDNSHSECHTVVDLGSEELTRGRPHPMLDARVRRARLGAEIADPENGGPSARLRPRLRCGPDPVGDLADAIAAAGDVVVLASVGSTVGDLQGLARREHARRTVGAIVLETNAIAARAAARLAQRAVAGGLT
jgi:FdrA protein